MPNKQPSFTERRERIEGIAETLRNIGRGLEHDARDLDREADRMIAAEKRFAAHRGEKRQRRAR